ncbi:hypothetical protein CC79DRAFT_1365494 [Sarocladium strictum]
MGAETDAYFPEQLVRDLEMSSAMFAAKNMTAGVPLSTSFVDDKGRLRASLFPYRRSASPGLHSGPAHIPSLGPIEERESMVSFLNQRNSQGDTTDGDSFADTEASGGMVGPCIPLREQSVVTAATSLASAGNLPSPKDPLPCDNSRIYSWIEADSDMEDHDYTAEYKGGFLSPRPPTPPESDNSLCARKGPVGLHHGSQVKRSLHRRSQSLAIDIPSMKPQRRLSGRSASAKLQSTPPLRDSKPEFHNSTTTFGGPGRVRRQASPPAHAVMQTPLPDDMDLDDMSSLPSLVAASPQLDDDFDDELGNDDNMYPVTYPARELRHEVYIRPSPPPSPPPTVQHVLTGNMQTFALSSSVEDGPRAVPLPPEVVETLRVSVTCFPETMLLTSSLTLETIRTYAKKVRHPHLGGIKLLAPSSAPPRQTAGKSIWRKVSSYRRGARSMKEEAGEVEAAPEPPKPWLAVKNIFGGASDYICDALYAHAVAYNYISALVPAQLPQSHSCPSPTFSVRDDIPRKAASLLGLSQQSTAADGAGATRSSSGPLSSWRRGSRTSSQPSSPSHMQQEAALRDVQVGLTRCVMGLVTTARTMAEEDGKGIGKGLVVLEGRAGDEYLMRSLLEVVRLSEEMC